MLLDDYVTSCIVESDRQTERSLSLSAELKSAIIRAIECTIDSRREHGFSINREHNKKSLLSAGELCSGTENRVQIPCDYSVGIDSSIFSRAKYIGSFHTHPQIAHGVFSHADNDNPWFCGKTLRTDHPLYIDMVWSQREFILYLIVLRGRAKYQTFSPAGYMHLINKEANESGETQSPYYIFSRLGNNADLYMLHKMTASRSFFNDMHYNAYFRAYKNHAISSNYDLYMASVVQSKDSAVYNRFDDLFLVVPPVYK